MRFKNPQNGYIEVASSKWSWLWCLLFGPVYFISKGNWRHALLAFLLAIVSHGITVFIYPFFVYSINKNFYCRKGWIQA